MKIGFKVIKFHDAKFPNLTGVFFPKWTEKGLHLFTFY